MMPKHIMRTFARTTLKKLSAHKKATETVLRKKLFTKTAEHYLSEIQKEYEKLMK